MILINKILTSKTKIKNRKSSKLMRDMMNLLHRKKQVFLIDRFFYYFHIVIKFQIINKLSN
jgi:hypothetical protein